MNAWLALLCAGLFEIGFTTCMKLSAGFTQIKFTLGFLICAIFSFLMLNKSLTHIPLGTAYAVWTGIGAFGTALIGIFIFKEPYSFARVFLLMILISSILGLKLIGSD